MSPAPRLAWLACLACLAVIAPGVTACVDAGRCEAAVAAADRTRAEALRQEAQIAWLRTQLATFASDLQARSYGDRELILRRLAALEAANAALLARLERAAPGALPPPPLPSPPLPPPPLASPAPAPPPPPAATPASPALDTASPYGPHAAAPGHAALSIDEASPY